MSSDERMRGFGAGLRRRRRAAGLTQVELAGRMAAHGLPWQGSTVSKTESGDRPPSLTELFGLTEALDVDMVGLLHLLGDPELIRAERAAATAAGARIAGLLEQVAQARTEQEHHLRNVERALLVRSDTLEQIGRELDAVEPLAGVRLAATPATGAAGPGGPPAARWGRSR